MFLLKEHILLLPLYFCILNCKTLVKPNNKTCLTCGVNGLH